MTSASKPVLFLPHHIVSLREMLTIARFLELEHGVEARMLCLREEFSAFLREEGFSEKGVIPLYSGTSEKAGKPASLSAKDLLLKAPWLVKILKAGKALLLGKRKYRQAAAKSFGFDKTLDRAREILRDENPLSLAVVSDNWLGQGWNLAFLRAARDLDIPTAIVPIAYSANKTSLMEMRRQGAELLAGRHPGLRKRFPGQSALDEQTGREYFFYHPMALAELDRLGMLPANPWVPGGGLSGRVLVEGEEAVERLASQGCAREKIVVTGHPSHDGLYGLLQDKKGLRRKLDAAYGLDPDKKLAVASLQQAAEHRVVTWDVHWKNIRALCRALSRDGINCLVSLHPRMDPAQYGFVESEYGLPVARERLADFLPAADVFSAAFSSTIFWAILCGIPTISYDLIGQDYDVFDSFPGVVKVRDTEQLGLELDKLARDPEHYSRLALAQREQAAPLAPFDGRSLARVARALLKPDQM